LKEFVEAKNAHEVEGVRHELRALEVAAAERDAECLGKVSAFVESEHKGHSEKRDKKERDDVKECFLTRCEGIALKDEVVKVLQEKREKAAQDSEELEKVVQEAEESEAKSPEEKLTEFRRKINPDEFCAKIEKLAEDVVSKLASIGCTSDSSDPAKVVIDLAVDVGTDGEEEDFTRDRVLKEIQTAIIGVGAPKEHLSVQGRKSDRSTGENAKRQAVAPYDVTATISSGASAQTEVTSEPIYYVGETSTASATSETTRITESNNGLTGGEVAGVVIGVIAAALLVVAILFVATKHAQQFERV